MLTNEDRQEIKQIIERELVGDVLHQLQGPTSWAQLPLDAIMRVMARATEVLGSQEKALRWLRAPVPSLGDQPPVSLLGSPEGAARVEDALGRIEHGVW